ncbi:unnamed protein product [Cylicocyclus nassatus]|uniref:SH3 domain-containing protein n=1 Tax=Cylicocyclus nassatus TaxID=53992 RepID=A0AA36GME0_CYLNA|nr:unnamed protein product [Cylicocyclus nassatus]
MKEPMFEQQSPENEVSVARAIFSNVSEFDEELPFEKGDVLRVLSERPEIEGISDGWWLCVDRNGRKGLAPANRLQVMHRFDKGFFQVANPLFDDFYMFNPQSSSPFDDPFFRERTRIFRNDIFDRIAPPLRRMNSCDDALRGVGIVRNIPIRVVGGGGVEGQGSDAKNTNTSNRIAIPIQVGGMGNRFQRRFSESSDGSTPRELRRAMSSGRISPTDATPFARSSGADEDAEQRSMRSDVAPHRTLIIPSTIPGKTIEIPLGTMSMNSSRQELVAPPARNERDRSPKPESQMEKLTQRLKNLTKPFRNPSHSTEVLDRDRLRSSSPDSSGISADITDSNSGEDAKRASDLSSLSSVDPNSSISDSSEEPKLQPPAIVRHPRQPYLTRLTRENPVSTSVLQTMFDNIERPELKRFAEDNKGKEWLIPTTVEEDMRRNNSADWNIVPTTVTPPKVNQGEMIDETIQARKRIVCSKMSESLKVIENSCAQINKITAPQHWRAPHLLQASLNSLRDAVITAHEAVDMFVDGTHRISIDRKNPKADEFDELLKPLLDLKNHMATLRKSLDSAGWTVAVLSRDNESPHSLDALEQIIAALNKAPSDCRRLLQWTQILIPSPTVVFLSPMVNIKPELPRPMNTARMPDKSLNLLGSPPFLDETKRLSSSSTSTVTSSDSSQPSSILVTKHNGDKPKGRVTFADEPRDRPSAASSDSSQDYSKQSQSNGTSKYTPHRLQETRIIEEDDLESVVSEGESLYQDYAYLDDVVPGRSNGTVGNGYNNSNISDEDRQLVRFYAPQLDQHTESLSLAVEEFLGTVENSLPPREFVQKGKLIILAAHKLIYIGDTVSQCVSDQAASNSLRQCADRLCEQLKECVKATKLASEEYPELKSMQGMVDSIIAVSKTAHEMKLLVKRWC